jgi:DNA-binding PadR family transcriptional regulator
LKRLGDFEQLLLFALLRLADDAYGRTIRAEILERMGRDVSPGAIYTALDRMEVQGLVSSYLAEGTPARGGRRRRHYHLEPAGEAALAAAWAAVSEMAEGFEDRLRRVHEADAANPEG